MTAKRASIPARLGIQDAQTAGVLDAVVENLEILTGRRGGKIAKLAAAIPGSVVSSDGTQTYAINALATGGAAVTAFSGLDGNTDEIYELIIRGSYAGQSTANGWIYLLPNGQTTTFTNAQWRWYWDGTAYTSGVAGIGGSAGWNIGTSDWNVGGQFFGRFVIYAKTGGKRLIQGQHVFSPTGFARVLGSSNVGEWEDTATNITSLALQVLNQGSFTGTATLRKVLSPSQGYALNSNLLLVINKLNELLDKLQA